MSIDTELPTVDRKEQLAGHMVDMRFGLPTQGVDYVALMDINLTFRAFRDEFGEQLGLKEIGAHIAVPDSELRVVAHVDGFHSDAEEIVPYVAQVVEGYGIVMPLGLPEYTTHTTALPEAS